MTKISVKRPPIPARLLKNPVHLISLGFGSGMSPIASGTIGTLAAIPLYLLMAPLHLWFYTLVTLLLLVLGIWTCGQTTKALGVEDHQGIVWDEVIGYLITMAAITPSIVSVLMGFFLFRFFDIFKIWPASWAERRFSGGLGIMFDDVMAGIYAALCMQIINHYIDLSAII